MKVETIVLPYLSTHYGAPMGRLDTNHNLSGKIVIAKLPMEEGYDLGGAYWGMPHNLVVAQDPDGYRFFRTEGLEEVKKLIENEHDCEVVLFGRCIFK